LYDLASDGGAAYWLESRPTEGGRVVLVRAELETPALTDLSPTGVSIRSRVHEYGGGAWCLVPGRGATAFAYVEQDAQQVWLCDGRGAVPRLLSESAPAGERWAHGGLTASPDGAWVLSVRESLPDDPHRGRTVRTVVALRVDGPPFASTLARGHDFYGAPQLDAGGRRLAVVVWDHPDMPWDRSALLVVTLDTAASAGGSVLVPLGEPWVVERGDDVSVGQPLWRRDGLLCFMSDRRGWWHPFEHSGQPDDGPARPLANDEADYHGPDWALGQHTMVELADGRLVLRRTAGGRDSLVVLDPDGGGDHSGTLPAARVLDQPCVAVAAVCAADAHKPGRVLCIGATPLAPTTVWAMDAGSDAAGTKTRTSAPTVLRPTGTVALPEDSVSVGEPFSVTGRAGRLVYGTLYRPTLAGTVGPDGPDSSPAVESGARPPLIVACHSGPTGAAGAGFDIVVQFFTSRGFAYATVDYAGSSGYGRAYRRALQGAWGVADAADCVDAARYLAAAGQVDGDRMAVRGSSAGGFTALNALAAGEAFAAAATWYGVTDLVALAESTHDFEAHYTDGLVGPLPAARATYEVRSPTRRAGDMAGAVLLLQGLDDPVVPPAQAEALRAALMAAGRPCEVRFFPGERHGFRRADTVQAALETELDFYRRYLDL
jgi:dipeptidyl aminopeptidase/acylaminoacyl peptidase